MLYFIKSQNYLKIGYTKDLESYLKRINNYKTHNPDFKVLDIVLEGTKDIEYNIHKELVKYSYYTEWFYDVPLVYEVWDKYTKDMNKFDPNTKKKEIIRNKKESRIVNDRMNKIAEDIYKVFGEECIMTGEEIKNTLSEIYSFNGAKFYPQIKTIENFGYSLKRFLKGNKFVYRVEKNLS